MSTLEKLEQQYNKEYETILNVNVQGKEMAGTEEAVEYFDNVIMRVGMKLLNEFNLHRGDVIMSDREAAAYVFACDALGLLDIDE